MAGNSIYYAKSAAHQLIRGLGKPLSGDQCTTPAEISTRSTLATLGTCRTGEACGRRAPCGPRTCGLAARVWSEHQADRAWLEWGFCWPPMSVRRPRCVSCGAAWPCAPAFAADEQMARREALAAIE
jgi:hypothetical protein